jgi:hypothetical protein
MKHPSHQCKHQNSTHFNKDVSKCCPQLYNYKTVCLPSLCYEDERAQEESIQSPTISISFANVVPPISPLSNKSTYSHSRSTLSYGGGVNTSTVVLRVVKGDGKGTQCLGVLRVQALPRRYKYGDLILQIWGVSNLRQ